MFIPFGPYRLLNVATIKEATFTPPTAATDTTAAVKARFMVHKIDGHGEFVDGEAAEHAWEKLCDRPDPVKREAFPGTPARTRKPRAPKATPAAPPAQPSLVE